MPLALSCMPQGNLPPTAALYLPTPLGRMYLAANEAGLTAVSLGTGPGVLPGTASREAFTLLERAVRELDQYFSGRRRQFDLPVCLPGTPFQHRVWHALCTIPYGETRSYAEVAALAGSPRACRAVGMANHNNPIMILVPCHRVIESSGALGGYGGGLAAKSLLLDLEQRRPY